MTIEDTTITDGTTQDRIRLTIDGARALGEAAMRGAGYDAENAGAHQRGREWCG